MEGTIPTESGDQELSELLEQAEVVNISDNDSLSDFYIERPSLVMTAGARFKDRMCCICELEARTAQQLLSTCILFTRTLEPMCVLNVSLLFCCYLTCMLMRKMFMLQLNSLAHSVRSQHHLGPKFANMPVFTWKTS